ncbi:MAG TPA: class I SAM-dependent methyltransferase [Bacteriovoracaceae bacterium]|nr:class I SAM-dependent methyltransferase [Bacteriovoracaceae bacterium]
MKGKIVNLNDYQSLVNRLKKNHKKLKNYISSEQIEAYRIYQKDLPQIPYLLDIYKDSALISEQGKRLNDETEHLRSQHLEMIQEALTQVFNIPLSKQYVKVRQRQKGTQQYQPYDKRSQNFFQIKEGKLTFIVNLERYLDSGLFLDHRPLRKKLANGLAKDKRVLNLFCYTGSLSVASAVGGAKEVYSTDLSATYLEWAYDNFLVNNLDPRKHQFVQADCLKELERLHEDNEKFDLILLDPPSFSNSKRMDEDLDIQEDHALLVRNCMRLLDPKGELYFSTNKKKFELHPIISEHYDVKEISHWTIPLDFHHSNIHRCFLISHKSTT